MNKNELRKIYSEKRKKLSPEAIADLSARIVEQFAQIALPGMKAVLSYNPIASRKEVDMGVCEQLLVARQPEIRIAHPRIIPASNFMEAVVVRHDTSFKDNDYFIKEPSHGEILTPESFDIVLVPLLAFDERGYRVGYGKGFYDRWLAQCRPGILKIGFSFFSPVEAIGDINEFDVPLNLCITPMRVYEF